MESKWRNIKNWFLPSNAKESEATRLLDITNEIIRKITRYAAQISESRNSAANRKEEYKNLPSYLQPARILTKPTNFRPFALAYLTLTI
ncbi:DUF2397 family protein [Caloramator sp. Dgby_cultured_2]|nr:DUF2397 family protein [Caloramator sp. Dgby_cultured_2]WDU84538.1 DUF2397 family protein [Caloramator sp. Dgby_cultured_2]